MQMITDGEIRDGKTIMLLHYIRLNGILDAIRAMNLKERYGSMALVAGASEGIGAAYARQLAAVY